MRTKLYRRLSRFRQPGIIESRAGGAARRSFSSTEAIKLFLGSITSKTALGRPAIARSLARRVFEPVEALESEEERERKREKKITTATASRMRVAWFRGHRFHERYINAVSASESCTFYKSSNKFSLRPASSFLHSAIPFDNLTNFRYKIAYGGSVGDDSTRFSQRL